MKTFSSPDQEKRRRKETDPLVHLFIYFIIRASMRTLNVAFLTCTFRFVRYALVIKKLRKIYPLTSHEEDSGLQ